MDSMSISDNSFFRVFAAVLSAKKVLHGKLWDGPISANVISFRRMRLRRLRESVPLVERKSNNKRYGLPRAVKALAMQLRERLLIPQKNVKIGKLCLCEGAERPRQSILLVGFRAAFSEKGSTQSRTATVGTGPALSDRSAASTGTFSI